VPDKNGNVLVPVAKIYHLESLVDNLMKERESMIQNIITLKMNAAYEEKRQSYYKQNEPEYEHPPQYEHYDLPTDRIQVFEISHL